MTLDDYDPYDIIVEDQRKDKGTRAAKGRDYMQRYIDAAIDYIRRNPKAPNTALDEQDLRDFRAENERSLAFGTSPSKPLEDSMDPFRHAKMLRELNRSKPERLLRNVFQNLFKVK